MVSPSITFVTLAFMCGWGVGYGVDTSGVIVGVGVGVGGKKNRLKKRMAKMMTNNFFINARVPDIYEAVV